jgi:hypothetical protein
MHSNQADVGSRRMLMSACWLPTGFPAAAVAAGAVAGTTMVTGALAQPETAEAPDASHGHDSREGHGAKLSTAEQGE